MKIKDRAMEYIFENQGESSLMSDGIDDVIEKALDAAIREAKKEVIDDIEAKSEKTVVSKCVGDDPGGYIIMDKDFEAIRKKHVG